MALRDYRLTLFTLSLLAIPGSSFAQQAATKAPVVASPQSLIAEAAQEGRYAFLLFYKQNDEPTKAMNSTLQAALADDEDRSVVVPVQVSHPANQALVAKHDVARAPMPMLLVVAPNGAITGVFAQKLSAANVQEAFVTPTMMTAMKSLQEGKLVFVTIQGTTRVTPAALKDFQSDPHFKDRMATITMRAADPEEGKFLNQVKIDAGTKATQTVLLAPPGVLVGSFAATATKDEIAGALAAAGKCCDDPNCKHHQPATAKKK